MEYQSGKYLKSIARDKMLGHYGTAVGAFLFMRMLMVAGMMLTSVMGRGNGLMYLAISGIIILLEGILVYGELAIYLKISVGMNTYVSDLFSGFKGNVGRAIKARLILVAILYGALFVGEGFNYLIAALSIENGNILSAIIWIVVVVVAVYLLIMYSQILYFMQDFSDINVKEACRRSRQLMKGNVLSFLGLYISFIPLYVIGGLSMMVGLYFIHPYVKMTLTEFYLDRVRQSQNNG